MGQLFLYKFYLCYKPPFLCTKWKAVWLAFEAAACEQCDQSYNSAIETQVTCFYFYTPALV